MYEIRKEIHFCYGHRLLDYTGKCRFFHGHNGKIEVLLKSNVLDDKGMVRDFSEVKTVLQTWVDDALDHRMLLNEKDPMLQALQDAGEPIVVMKTNPTAENIARFIFEQAVEKGLPVASVTLWETHNSSATYSQ